MPECPECALNGTISEMEATTSTQDYHDPADEHGHGQQEVPIWACNTPNCNHTEYREIEPPEFEPDYDNTP